MLRGLLLFSLGFYVAHRLETRLAQKKLVMQEHEAIEGSVDETLEDSFPASDAPNFSTPASFAAPNFPGPH